jgi:hypothetical protein
MDEPYVKHIRGDPHPDCITLGMHACPVAPAVADHQLSIMQRNYVATDKRRAT